MDLEIINQDQIRFTETTGRIRQINVGRELCDWLQGFHDRATEVMAQRKADDLRWAKRNKDKVVEIGVLETVINGAMHEEAELTGQIATLQRTLQSSEAKNKNLKGKLAHEEELSKAGRKLVAQLRAMADAMAKHYLKDLKRVVDDGQTKATENAIACYVKMLAFSRARLEIYQRGASPDCALATRAVVEYLESELERMRDVIARKADPGAGVDRSNESLVPDMRSADPMRLNKNSPLT